MRIRFFRSNRLIWAVVFSGLGLGLASTPGTYAATAGVEEITVTAQRTEESIQDVPIAVSAFTGSMLTERQIIEPTDLQLNTPNVTFTATNFGGSSFSIRGIGNLVIGSGDPGVSIHLNEIAVPTNLPATEFYDMERIEVLRGPQGTLFGRNATGGVVNMITAKPSVDAVSGDLNVEYGSYEAELFKGALNVPVTDDVAIRVAGMRLKRDGYIENTANGQTGCARGTGGTTGVTCVPVHIDGIKDSMDGRDLYTYRVTGLWNISDNASAWVLYGKFHENDDKVRITNQVCQQNPLPVQGCTPDGFGFDVPNAGATTGGIFVGLNGGVLLGDPSPTNAFTVPSTGFRKQHTDFQPVYKYDEDLFQGNFRYEFDKLIVTLQGGFETNSYISLQDYNVDVGFNMNPVSTVPCTPATTPLCGGAVDNPTGYWPTSRPAGQFNEDWTSSVCNFNAGTSGIFGGCIFPADTTRLFAYDQSDQEQRYYTVEAKVNSSFDGPLNFLLGVNYAKDDVNGDYYVVSNSLDLVGIYGVPLLGFPPLYPTMYNNTGGPHGSAGAESTAVFGEVYYQMTDAIKFTAGLRYNDDKKDVSDSSVLFNSLDACAIGLAPFLPDCANGPVWQRSDLAPLYEGIQEPAAVQLAQYYGVYDTYLNALLAGDLDTAFQALSGVPPAPGFNEQRALTGSPDKADWQETTGRFGVDWRVTENSMAYAFYTRGYKPGGFNPAQNAAFILDGSTDYTFDPEKVDAYEIGTKNAFLDGGLVVNGTVFYYTYTGLQVSRIANNNSINGNIDANIYGAELETTYVPSFLPRLQIDFSYSYLNTAVDNTESVDPLNRTAGDPNFIALENIDPGSLTGVNYVANVTQITPTVIQQAFLACGALSAANGSAGCPQVAPGTDYPNGVPAYFSRAYLDSVGVVTSDGLPVDIDGNQLPNSPENKIHIGIAYTFAFSFGTITPRFDYAWQDDSYAREFNTVGDEIGSWDQMNASLSYESNDGRWQVRAWIRNINDEDNVTGKYLTSDTSGFFRNYFLTDPRVYGMALTYNFGALQ